MQRQDQINFVLPEVFPLKLICNHIYITIIHKSIFLLGHHQFTLFGNAPDKYDKIIVLIFFSVIAMSDVPSCNLWSLKQQEIAMLKNILIVLSPYS